MLKGSVRDSYLSIARDWEKAAEIERTTNI
jgi:hypothetical protein